MKYDSLGRELPDATPIEIPLGLRKPETLQEQIRRLVRTEFSQASAKAGFESFDEANDFECEDGDAELHATEFELEPEVPNERGGFTRTRKDAQDADDGDPSTQDDDGGKPSTPPGDSQRAAPGGGKDGPGEGDQVPTSRDKVPPRKA